MEIGRRRAAEAHEAKAKTTSSCDASTILTSLIGDLQVEKVWVLFLNEANLMNHKKQISKGGISQTAVDVRIILKIALQEMATGIILAHNHPSGKLKPSKADYLMTQKVKKAAETLDLNVLDHLIVTQKSYFSFADEGEL